MRLNSYLSLNPESPLWDQGRHSTEKLMKMSIIVLLTVAKNLKQSIFLLVDKQIVGNKSKNTPGINLYKLMEQAKLL